MVEDYSVCHAYSGELMLQEQPFIKYLALFIIRMGSKGIQQVKK